MLRLENICKTYGANKILENINFTVPKQQLTAIIGSNGTGKSTFLSIASRVLAQTSGNVFLKDKNIKDWHQGDLAKEISILEQSSSLNVKLSVKELVSFGRFPHSHGKIMKNDEEIINLSLNQAKIYELRHRYLDELSGGQRQMAYIAMIIAQDTPYIFLDEPLNNLDMKHSKELMGILKELVARGKSIVVVIHDINFVSVYADFVVAIKDKKILFQGEKNEIIKDEILNKIFDMQMKVREIDGKKVCIYY